MRNLLFAFLSLILLTHTTLAQNSTGANPFYDAVTLRGYIDQLAKNPMDPVLTGKVLTLLGKYGSIHTLSDLKTLIAGNNFLQDITKNLAETGITERPLDLGPGTPTGATGGSSPLSATNIGGAIGTFIANRFKQEVETAFLDHFSSWVNDNRYHYTFEALLRQTQTVLLGANPYQYTTYLQALKEALKKDFDQMPVNLEKYLESPHKDDPLLSLVTGKPFYYPSVFVFRTALSIKNTSSIIADINAWSEDVDPLFGKLGPIKPWLELLSAWSVAMTVDPQSDAPSYIGLGDISRAFSPKVGKPEYVLGLFLLENKATLSNVPVSKTTVYDIINGQSASLDTLTTWIIMTCGDLAQLGDAFDKLSPNGNSQATLDAVASFIQSAADGLSCPLMRFDTSCKNDDLRNIIALIKNMGATITDIQDKTYGLLVTHVTSILQEGGLASNSKALTVIRQYGSFAASVVSATNQQEVTDALETAAMPVGSYRVKRTAYLDIALNAYAGGFYGYQQYFRGEVPANVNTTNTLAGFTAPVGISISKALSHNQNAKGSSSATLFLSVIDVGAVTAFRLQNDNTANLPDFTWANLLAPGGFFIYGFKNSPLSVSAGIQYGPGLRSLTATSTTVVPPAWSMRVGLLIDIPVFDFYTKTISPKAND